MDSEEKTFFGILFVIVLANVIFWASVIALGFYAVNRFTE
jgi:hypothetical protein